jgi:hypothetical protein
LIGNASEYAACSALAERGQNQNAHNGEKKSNDPSGYETLMTRGHGGATNLHDGNSSNFLVRQPYHCSTRQVKKIRG